MIYARLDTTTEPPLLDWGHEVYPAAGQTIESLGYREFPDIATAREFYGLPSEEEELLTTNNNDND